MKATTRTAPRELPGERADTLTLPDGRHVEHGAEVTVERLGRCVFIGHVSTDGAEWVDVIDRRGFHRSRRPDEIRTIHRSRRIFANPPPR